VFRHQTVEALAAAVTEAGEDDGVPGCGAHAESPDAGTGAVEPTPVMRWMRELGGLTEGFNQSVLLRVPPALDTERLTRAVQVLLDHHDALRLRVRDDGPDWGLDVGPRGSVAAGACVRRVDVTGLEGEASRALMAEQALAARDRLRPADGVMLQAVAFDRGARRPGRLLLVVHHLAVDGVSWRILLPDLRAAWEALAAGRTPHLEPVGTSLRRWAQGLTAAAHRPERLAELPWWSATLRGQDPPLGRRPLDPLRDVAGTAHGVRLTLPAQHTEPLLTRVPAAYHAGVDDVLLTGLALAFGDWRRRTGRPGGSAVLVDREGHGWEETAVDGADLSRTVGWFTAVHPVRLDPEVSAWDEVWSAAPLAGPW
jgi:hypothetical protein